VQHREGHGSPGWKRYWWSRARNLRTASQSFTAAARSWSSNPKHGGAVWSRRRKRLRTTQQGAAGLEPVWERARTVVASTTHFCFERILSREGTHGSTTTCTMYTKIKSRTTISVLLIRCSSCPTAGPHRASNPNTHAARAVAEYVHTQCGAANSRTAGGGAAVARRGAPLAGAS